MPKKFFLTNLQHFILNQFSTNAYIVQEVFHVYLNKFEIAVTHLFFVILCKSGFT